MFGIADGDGGRARLCVYVGGKKRASDCGASLACGAARFSTYPTSPLFGCCICWTMFKGACSHVPDVDLSENLLRKCADGLAEGLRSRDGNVPLIGVELHHSFHLDTSHTRIMRFCFRLHQVNIIFFESLSSSQMRMRLDVGASAASR